MADDQEWAELGDEVPQTQEEQENPDNQEWEELGDETGGEAAQQGIDLDGDGVADVYPTLYAADDADPTLRAEEQYDDAPQENPDNQQWEELGDEQPQQQEEQQEQQEEQQEEQQAPPAQYPTEERAVAAPSRARALVKPKQKTQNVSRWEPLEYDAADDSDDEFELSTCLRPIYDEQDQDEATLLAQMKNGRPDCDGEIISCFDDPNLLYRITNKEDKTWAFYNDSLDYEMHIRFFFGKHSKIEPLGDTTMQQDDDGTFVTEVIVYPTETEMFIKGNVNGFTSKIRAIPLSEDYHRARNEAVKETLEAETRAVQDLVGPNATSEEALEACINNGVMFVDPEFPPCQQSLEAGGKKQFKPLAWARPRMFLPAELEDQIRLFRCPVKPGVVTAGELGDVWVMCSVCAVSEEPQRLRGMFRHPNGKAGAQREHAVGAYRVTFNKDGWWRSVVVDDYLPVSAGKPCYARSANSPAEIWPCILEKAFAKLHGSYAKIVTGDPLHALQDMTGFSTYRFDEGLEKASTENDYTLFNDLQRAVRAGYTIIFSTPGKNSTSKSDELAEQYASVGLLTGHAYTILDAKRFPEVDDLRLLKVRNAWGHGIEWNGDWGDNCDKWEQYPEVAEECNFQKAEDGIFWITFEEAMKYFNGGGLCFTHEPAYDYRLNSCFIEGVPSAVLEMEVTSPTWVTFVISQEDKRGREEGAEYQPVMISAAQPFDNNMYKVFLNSTSTGVRPSTEKWVFLQARDVSLIHKFEAGNYIIIPRVMATEGSVNDVPYTLGVISSAPLGDGQVSIKCKSLPKDNRVFENFPKFEPELKPVEQAVQYQKRTPGSGFPNTQETECDLV